MNIDKEKANDAIKKLKLDDRGLIPAIIQDSANKDVLMVAWMNIESLRLTLETSLCHYWSRSRQKLWKKGETSGHFQHVQWIRYDCDADALLIGVVQDGAACHTGERSCFYRDLEKD